MRAAAPTAAWSELTAAASTLPVITISSLVGLARNHCLVEQLTITLHIQLRLDVRGDRGVKIRDAQLVIPLRRFHALLRLGEVGRGMFDCDLVVDSVESGRRRRCRLKALNHRTASAR
jgi:hypothetical protein